MKKAICIFALAVALVLAGPALSRIARERLFPQAAQPAGEAAQGRSTDALSPMGGAQDELEATLYYRFGQTPLLGMERVRLDVAREETVASRIVARLIEGPSASHAQLSGVFPQGTRAISVGGDGSTAFVTLNSAFLGRPDGAPADWEDSAIWQREAALRRLLAVQSVTLALTEDGRYQRVQFYIADSDDDAPRRIELYWFDAEETDPTPVLAACGRDESALLTPRRALETALDAWRTRDWPALYALLTEEGGLPSLSAFEQQMREIDATLLTFEASEGAVSADGQRATLVLHATLRDAGGGETELTQEAVPLVRAADNWTLRLSTLLSLMVRD